MAFQRIGTAVLLISQNQDALFELINDLKARVILLSYNCEGFVKKFFKAFKYSWKMSDFRTKYNTFRASRNLKIVISIFMNNFIF